MNKIKRLFFDIETSYSVVATFTLWPKSIPQENILKDWNMLCAAWKWEGNKKIYGACGDGTNDKEIAEQLREAVIEADEIVYHNGRKFDYKKLNTRVLLNGLQPMVKPKECDTLLQCRKHFGFTSNRLDYIGKILGLGGKLKAGNRLWLDSLDGDADSLKKMFTYCKRDVTLLEDVYHKLQPHIDVSYNGNLDNLLGLNCPEPTCNSTNYQHRGWSRTKVSKYQRYQCQDCGRWFQSGNKEKTAGVPLR